MTPGALVAIFPAVALAIGSAPVAAAQGSVGPWGQLRDGKRPLFERTNPLDDHTFYQAQARGELEGLAPGTILAERTIPYHVATIPAAPHESSTGSSPSSATYPQRWSGP